MPTPDSIVPTEENISTPLSGQHAAETESSSVPKAGKVIYTAMVHSTGGRSGGPEVLTDIWRLSSRSPERMAPALTLSSCSLLVGLPASSVQCRSLPGKWE